VEPGFRKPGAVVISPAGEKLVRFAVIANDCWRSAGRSGVGTVMGSKLVKAVLFQGDRRRPVAAYVRELSKHSLEHPAAKAYKTLETTMVLKMTQSATDLNPSVFETEFSVEVQGLDDNGSPLTSVTVRGPVDGSIRGDLVGHGSMPPDKYSSIVNWVMPR
jgi:hypothetical protein